MGMILDGIELPVCCGEGFRIYPYNGDVIITCDGTPEGIFMNKCNKSKRLGELKDGILWEDCDYCGGDLYEETKKSTSELPDDVEDLTVCEYCWEKHYTESLGAESKETEDDDDYLPDFLKEDSVVESPFGLDDMVMPHDYEWNYLIDDYSVEGIKKARLGSLFIKLTGNQRRTLDKIRAKLYNWDSEPSYSDIFHKEFCKTEGVSLSVLKTLEKKGLIKLSKGDEYYFKERGYIVYPKPMMYAFYIINEEDYPDWFIPEAKEKGLWKAESFEARGYAPDKPFYATTHENWTTTVMHPIKCGHYKMVMNGTGVWMSPTFYDTIEEMFTDKFDEIMDTQAGGMIDYLDTEIGQETKRKYQAIKTIGDARKFAKRHFDFKIDFAPCFRKERDYDSKALNALPITVAPIYDEDYFDAESKKMNPLEKAGISGMASGATMEGLETLLAAEELSEKQLSAYFARLESQKPDLAREIEFSVKNEDELPTQKIYDAGFNPSVIEEWVDLVGVEDENLQPYESCSTCEGEGYVLTSYTSATRFDPADGDGEDCEVCGGTGMIDPSDYMDKEGQYYAESFEAEEYKKICEGHGPHLHGGSCKNCWPTDKTNPMSGCECSPQEIAEKVAKAPYHYGKEPYTIHQSNRKNYSTITCKDCGNSWRQPDYGYSPIGSPSWEPDNYYPLSEMWYQETNEEPAWLQAESFEAETCPECKTNSEYICDSCAQCKGCCETSYGCYEIALCNDCDGSFIGKDIEGCCGSCDNCCECDTESFEARDDSWCVNHGWIRGTKIGDIIPCSNCNDMICDGCRCGGCGNCETSDCCECDRTYDAESLDDMKIKYGNRDRIFFIKSVDYDTDGEITNDELPQEFTIKIPSNYHYFDEDADEGDITDVLNEWISTETGFSTKGIVWIEEENNSWRKSAEEKESIIKSPYVWGVGIVGILGYVFTRKL